MTMIAEVFNGGNHRTVTIATSDQIVTVDGASIAYEISQLVRCTRSLSASTRRRKPNSPQ